MGTVSSRMVAAIVAVGLIGAVVSACSGGDDALESAIEGSHSYDERDMDGPVSADMAAMETQSDGSGAGGSLSAVSLPGTGPNIIKEATLDLEVGEEGFQEAVNEAVRVAERTGGFVLRNSVDDAEGRTGRLVLRIPSTEFESALSALAGLGDVQAQEVSGTDVTEEFIDLEGRLRNLEAQEAVLLDLMDRARSVSDTIKVQRELTGIQLDIEQIKGRLRFLEDRTALGTISMSITEVGVTTAEPGPLSDAWQRALDGAGEVIAGVIVAVGYALPLALLVLMLLGAFRLVRPRFRTEH